MTQPWRVAIILGIAFPLVFPRAGFAATSSEERQVGAEEERLRRPKPKGIPPLPIAPVQLPPEEEAPPPAGLAEKFRVTRVAVEGADLLPDKEVKSITGSLIDRTLTLRELQRAAQAITQWYRGRGYIASRAFIPAQGVENGLVRIRVIEGKMGQLKVEGNRFFSTRILAAQVKVKPGEILRLSSLEESLRALNSHPDRKAKFVLARGTRPETTDLILQVVDHQPLHAGYGVDTLGTKATGQIRQGIVISHGNLTGHDDQAFLRWIVSEFGGLQGGVFSLLTPLSPGGPTATLDVSGVKSNIGGDLKDLLARGEAITVSPGLIVPWIRRANWELEAVAGFDAKRIRTRLDEVTNSKDDLRVTHLGTNLLTQDRRGQGLIAQELRVGIGNFLGGSHSVDPAASRTGAGGSFLRWVVNLARVQKGPRGTWMVFRGSSQVTSDRLVPAEQMRLGGLDTVRGYPEGTTLADFGYQISLEIRKQIFRSFLLVGFWDFAEGFLRSPRAGEDADARLTGVGCGFRLRPTSESTLQIDFGWPIGDRDPEKDRPRLHLICRIGF